ncbi:MAG: redoxin domain-containing protein [Bacteroidales bacterium]|nr:redoxin domain-containing protein [Bacteroidales bacterium]
MKIRSILFATLGVAVIASCGGKVSDVTKITGTVVPEGISEVNIVVGELVDTLVPVVDGKFAIDVPADVTAMATVSAANYGTSFISDGTPLTVVLDEETKVTSAYPEISVNEKLVAFNEASKAYVEKYRTTQQEIKDAEDKTDQEKEQALNEFYESFFAEYNEYNKKTYTENTDNFVALYALQSLIGEFEDPELDSLLNLLAPALQEHKFVQGMQQAIKARINTAEGKPFIDFTVNSVVGMTRSVPPQPKYAEVKFSDYVGKGKYILVDFWAPWCGPCKREIPNLKAVYDKYAGKNFDILSIAVWERQPVQVTIDTAAELGMNWSHINNAGSVPTEIYGVEGIPHLMLIGPDGTILKRGFHGAEGINAAVAEYLD